MAEHQVQETANLQPLLRLKRTRTAVAIAILVERLWPRSLPFVVLVSVFFSLAWLGVFRILPDWGRIGLVALFAFAGLAALWPLRSFRLPTSGEIDRRVEEANQLEHAPLGAQTDRLAGGEHDPFAAALWQEHQRRMAARLEDLEADLPRTTVPERDPLGIRALAALLFVTALAFSNSPYGGRITDAFRPPALAQPTPARIDAWVTPPAYTGRAPIFLTAEVNREIEAFTIPQNSIMTVRVSGNAGEGTLRFVGDDGDELVIDPESGVAGEEGGPTGATRFSHLISTDGNVVLQNGWEVHDWRFVVVPDRPPEIRLTEEPKRAANGTLELAYEIKDDYGAASAEAHFNLIEENADARPLYGAPEMQLTLPRTGKDGRAKTSRDLTQHPWSGLEVELELSAIDGADQMGKSEKQIFLLPERPFTNPLAKALIEQRRLLALDAQEQNRVLALMNAVLLWPEETFADASQFLLVSALRSQLSNARTSDALRKVVDEMWEVAVLIEDGELSDAERRLRQAQEALENALEEGASDEEIARLMDELRSAMQDFLREFAERAMQNQEFSENQGGEVMTQRDLERMLDQIEELARSGARDQAQELLSQLQNMMNNLQAMQQQQPGQNGQRSQMRQQMDQLGEIMRRQQELMNETFRLDQQGQQGSQGQQGQGQPQEGQQGQGRPGEGQQGEGGQGLSPEELAEALRGLQEGQGELQGQLQSLMQSLEDMGIRPGEGFGEAGEAMGEAESALGEGRGDQAVGEQGRALEALRRGAQDMMNQMQQAMQGDQGEGMSGARQNTFGRDPLGRPRATTGPDFGDSVQIPDEIDAQRARQILESIRRRLGDATSPQFEREYLERLLDLR